MVLSVIKIGKIGIEDIWENLSAKKISYSGEINKEIINEKWNSSSTTTESTSAINLYI